MKNKKTIRRRLLGVVLIAFLITISGPAVRTVTGIPTSQTAYAALACPDGWTQVDNMTCSKSGSKEEVKDLKCPSGTTKDKTSSETKLVCTEKITASVTDNEAVRGQISSLLSIQGALNRLIWPVLVMIGGLMDNSLLFGNGMEERLRAIWVPIRNMVNILFVVALVGVALYNVLGIGEENGNYSIKTILPKIIIGIIAVNFSFLGMKVFLDGVSVITNSVFALPGQVSEGLTKVVDPNSQDEFDKNLIKRFCLQLEGRTNTDMLQGDEALLKIETEEIIYKDVLRRYPSIDATNMTIAQMDAAIEGIKDKSKKDKIRKEIEAVKAGAICLGPELTTQGKAFLNRWNSRNAALAMALNMTGIVFYQDIPTSVDTIEKLAINSIFSVMLYIIYVASFVALFIVLLARLVVLWLAIAISPILVLGWALPVVKEKISGFGTVVDHFVKNAIAPIGIALAMSVGWIMLQALQSVGGFDAQDIMFQKGAGIPVVGLSTLQDLIVAFGTVASIWVAVFAAANETIAGRVTEAMQGGIQRVGSFLVKTPLRNIPVGSIKVPGHDDVTATLGGIKALSDRIGYSGTSTAEDKFVDKVWPTGRSQLSDIADSNKTTTAAQVAKNIVDNDNKYKDGSKEAKNIVDRFMKNNRGLYRSMSNSKDSNERNLAKQLENFKNSNDDNKRKEIGQEIVRLAGSVYNKRRTTGSTSLSTAQKQILDEITDNASKEIVNSAIQESLRQGISRTEIKKKLRTLKKDSSNKVGKTGKTIDELLQ